MPSKPKNTATKGESKPALAPKLRFPEFHELKGWSPTMLNVIANPVTERAIEGEEDNVLSLSAEHGIVLQSEFFGKKVAGDNSERYLKISHNDFVYNDRTTKASTFGTIKRLSKHSGGIVSPIYKCFRFHADENPAFWEQYFESRSHDASLRGLVNEGARAGRFNITITQFLSTAAPRPDEAEQQKIAECLSSVDEVIAAQARKVDALKDHKKGLMQQLFPREGETQPRLRFPEFQNAGEWARMSIQEMIDQQFIVGHLDGNHGELYPKAEEFSPNKEGIPYITANDFISGIVEFSRCKRLPIERARLFKKGVAKDGDILFAHNATVGPVAKLSTSEEFVILSTTATYFRCNTKRLSNDFLKAALASPDFVAQYSRVMSQSTRNQVPITTQRKFDLHLPKLPEQHRIATCLSSLDTLIAAETQKHAALQRHKKGLLQQLFPSPEEVEA